MFLKNKSSTRKTATGENSFVVKRFGRNMLFHVRGDNTFGVAEKLVRTMVTLDVNRVESGSFSIERLPARFLEWGDFVVSIDREHVAVVEYACDVPDVGDDGVSLSVSDFGTLVTFAMFAAMFALSVAGLFFAIFK